MKKILLLAFVISLKTLAQSVEIKPGSNGFVMIPNVSTLATCAAADKGKIVYYGTDNTLRMCNGSSWLNMNASSGLALPLDQSVTTASNAFKITNFDVGDNSAIVARSFSENDGGGILGVASNSNPSSNTFGVKGVNVSTNSLGYGVMGSHGTAGTGVFGITNSGRGVFGYGNSGYGMYGYSTTGIGVYGSSATGTGASFSSSYGKALITSGPLRFGGTGVGLIESGMFLKSTNINGDAEWSDLFPYYISKDMGTGNPFWINNTNPSSVSVTIYGGSNSPNSLTGGVRGDAHHTSPTQNTFGLRGNNYSSNSLGYGVIGVHSGTGIAVKGETIDGTGGHFESTNSNALITGKGKVGIGNASPNLNAEDRMEINGRLRIRDSTNTAGVWFNNATNGIGIDNGSFFGLENATPGAERSGIWIGSAWRFYINRLGQTTFTGFTQLGNNVPVAAAPGATAPAIKTLKLVGTTNANQGLSTSISHGLSTANIIGVQVFVQDDAGNWLPPENTFLNGVRFTYYQSNSQIVVQNYAGQSGQILSNNIKILITYEE